MPLPPADPIVLSLEQRAALEGLVRAHRTGQQLALRARMILLLADGIAIHEVARRLGVWPKTVRHWRKRWMSSSVGVAECLSDAPRPGAPATITPEQICALVALACEPPEAGGVPITHWSQSELAREAVRRGLMETISQRSVGRILKRSRPQAPPRAAVAHAQA
ncbi:MAG: helix-turn-helix domain-containing protein [Alphaproteobacteria bacterium]